MFDQFSSLVLTNLSWSEGYSFMQPVALFVLALVMYSLFIFKFYKFLAKKDIFPFEIEKYTRQKHKLLSVTIHGILYAVKYILLFPLISMFWFAVFAILLAFLSRDPVPASILLTSISIISAARLTSYYSEDLSTEVAKLLPLVLLGIFLIDISYFNVDKSIQVIQQFPGLWKSLLYYALFVICLEFTLKIAHTIVLEISALAASRQQR